MSEKSPSNYVMAPNGKMYDPNKYDYDYSLEGLVPKGDPSYTNTKSKLDKALEDPSNPAHEAAKANAAHVESYVEKPIKETLGLSKDGETKHTEQGTVAKADSTIGNAYNDALKASQRQISDYLNSVKNIDPSYKDSLSGVYDEASDKDKRILLTDQIFTTLKNISNLRPYMGSAFTNSQEERGLGTEESLMEKGMKENFKKGLERRNNRLNEQFEKQMQLAGVPADMENFLRSQWESGKLNNYQKTHLIALMKDVKFWDALKAGLNNSAASGQLQNNLINTATGILK